MKTRQEYIDILQHSDATLRQEYGVKSLRLFGSVAREEHTADSDIDVCVDGILVI